MAAEFDSLEFTNLPLIEVAARLVFEPGTLDLSLDKTIRLAKALNGWLASVEHLTSIETTPRGSKIERGKLLSVVFVGQLHSVRLSIQNNMLKWSWTKEVGPGFHEYPRYRQLRTDLFWFAQAVQTNLTGSELPVLSLNMGYTNFVPSPGHTPHETILRYLSEPMRAKAIELGTYFHEITLNWREPSGLDRKLQFLNATAEKESDKQLGCLLATNVGSFARSGVQVEKILDEIHTDLQTFFLSAITETAKQEWGYAKRG